MGKGKAGKEATEHDPKSSVNLYHDSVELLKKVEMARQLNEKDDNVPGQLSLDSLQKHQEVADALDSGASVQYAKLQDVSKMEVTDLLENDVSYQPILASRLTRWERDLRSSEEAIRQNQSVPRSGTAKVDGQRASAVWQSKADSLNDPGYDYSDFHWDAPPCRFDAVKAQRNSTLKKMVPETVLNVISLGKQSEWNHAQQAARERYANNPSTMMKLLDDDVLLDDDDELEEEQEAAPAAVVEEEESKKDKKKKKKKERRRRRDSGDEDELDDEEVSDREKGRTSDEERERYEKQDEQDSPRSQASQSQVTGGRSRSRTLSDAKKRKVAREQDQNIETGFEISLGKFMRHVHRFTTQTEKTSITNRFIQRGAYDPVSAEESAFIVHKKKDQNVAHPDYRPFYEANNLDMVLYSQGGECDRWWKHNDMPILLRRQDGATLQEGAHKISTLSRLAEYEELNEVQKQKIQVIEIHARISGVGSEIPLLNRFKSLSILILTNAGLRSVKGLTLPQLRYLDLKFNELSNPKELVEVVKPPRWKLESVDLTGNPLCEKENWFIPLILESPYLRFLNGELFDAKRRSRIILDEGTAKHKKRLPEQMWQLALLSNAEIRAQTADTWNFKSLFGITTLALEGNSLRKVRVGTFRGLQNLDLSRNQISSLRDSGIVMCQQLQTVNVKDNKLDNFDELEIWGQLHKLKNLQIEGNPIVKPGVVKNIINRNAEDVKLRIVYLTRFAYGTDKMLGLEQLDAETITVDNRIAAIKRWGTKAEVEMADAHRLYLNLLAVYGHSNLRHKAFGYHVTIAPLNEMDITQVHGWVSVDESLRTYDRCRSLMMDFDPNYSHKDAPDISQVRSDRRAHRVLLNPIPQSFLPVGRGLQTMPGLTYLDLSENKLSKNYTSKVLPLVLRQLPMLKFLDLFESCQDPHWVHHSKEELFRTLGCLNNLIEVKLFERAEGDHRDAAPPSSNIVGGGWKNFLDYRMDLIRSLFPHNRCLAFVDEIRVTPAERTLAMFPNMIDGAAHGSMRENTSELNRANEYQFNVRVLESAMASHAEEHQFVTINGRSFRIVPYSQLAVRPVEEVSGSGSRAESTKSKKKRKGSNKKVEEEEDDMLGFAADDPLFTVSGENPEAREFWFGGPEHREAFNYNARSLEELWLKGANGQWDLNEALLTDTVPAADDKAMEAWEPRPPSRESKNTYFEPGNIGVLDLQTPNHEANLEDHNEAVRRIYLRGKAAVTDIKAWKISSDNIPSNFFEAFENLVHLNLSHNRITSTRFLKSLTKLKELDLSHNLIGEAGDEEGGDIEEAADTLSFLALNSLKKVMVAGNPFVGATKTGSDWYSSGVFDLVSQMPCFHGRKKDVKNLPKYMKLDRMDGDKFNADTDDFNPIHCELKTIDQHVGSKLRKEAFAAYYGLEVEDKDKKSNKKTAAEVDKFAFALAVTEQLNLFEERLFNEQPTHQGGAKSKKKKLAAASAGDDDLRTRTRHLTLSNMSLGAIDRDILSKYKQLTKLSLRKNVIRSIADAGLEGLGSLRALDLRENNIPCSDVEKKTVLKIIFDCKNLESLGIIHQVLKEGDKPWVVSDLTVDVFVELANKFDRVTPKTETGELGAPDDDDLAAEFDGLFDDDEVDLTDTKTTKAKGEKLTTKQKLAKARASNVRKLQVIDSTLLTNREIFRNLQDYYAEQRASSASTVDEKKIEKYLFYDMLYFKLLPNFHAAQMLKGTGFNLGLEGIVKSAEQGASAKQGPSSKQRKKAGSTTSFAEPDLSTKGLSFIDFRFLNDFNEKCVCPKLPSAFKWQNVITGLYLQASNLEDEDIQKGGFEVFQEPESLLTVIDLRFNQIKKPKTLLDLLHSLSRTLQELDARGNPAIIEGANEIKGSAASVGGKEEVLDKFEEWFLSNWKDKKNAESVFHKLNGRALDAKTRLDKVFKADADKGAFELEQKIAEHKRGGKSAQDAGVVSMPAKHIKSLKGAFVFFPIPEPFDFIREVDLSENNLNTLTDSGLRFLRFLNKLSIVDLKSEKGRGVGLDFDTEVYPELSRCDKLEEINADRSIRNPDQRRAGRCLEPTEYAKHLFPMLPGLEKGDGVSNLSALAKDTKANIQPLNDFGIGPNSVAKVDLTGHGMNWDQFLVVLGLLRSVANSVRELSILKGNNLTADITAMRSDAKAKKAAGTGGQAYKVPKANDLMIAFLITVFPNLTKLEGKAVKSDPVETKKDSVVVDVFNRNFCTQLVTRLNGDQWFFKFKSNEELALSKSKPADELLLANLKIKRRVDRYNYARSVGKNKTLFSGSGSKSSVAAAKKTADAYGEYASDGDFGNTQVKK